jgi:hypothetical protein
VSTRHTAPPMRCHREGGTGRYRRPPARYVELTRPGPVIASALDGPRTSPSR